MTTGQGSKCVCKDTVHEQRGADAAMAMVQLWPKFEPPALPRFGVISTGCNVRTHSVPLGGLPHASKPPRKAGRRLFGCRRRLTGLGSLELPAVAAAASPGGSCPGANGVSRKLWVSYNTI
jgi:hypothetical protein